MRVKALLLLVAFAMPCRVLPAFAAEAAVNVVRHGQSVVVFRDEQVAAALVALAESCSVNSTAYAVYADSWETALTSGSFVQVTFKSPATLLLPGLNDQARQPHQVRRLLLPLPVGRWPEHLFAEVDGETISFTKFQPLAFKGLVLEPELLLSAELPYSFLLRIPSGR